MRVVFLPAALYCALGFARESGALAKDYDCSYDVATSITATADFPGKADVHEKTSLHNVKLRSIGSQKAYVDASGGRATLRLASRNSRENALYYIEDAGAENTFLWIVIAPEGGKVRVFQLKAYSMFGVAATNSSLYNCR